MKKRGFAVKIIELLPNLIGSADPNFSNVAITPTQEFAQKRYGDGEKPAQAAGLLKGDIVVQLGDSTVYDMMSYMRALSAFQKGDSTKVVLERSGQKVEAVVKF